MPKSKKVKITVEIVRKDNTLPLVGWHDPFGKFKHNGEEYEIQITGGCEGVCISQGSKRVYISIEEIVADLMPEIEQVLGGRK